MFTLLVGGVDDYKMPTLDGKLIFVPPSPASYVEVLTPSV